MSTAPSNHRASLLSGLRTGGVRSVSSNVPHTAAPGGSFNIPAPRFTSNTYQHQQQQHHFNVFPDEEDEIVDQIAEMPPSSRNQFPYQNMGGVNRQAPMTAAVDGPNNRFSQQQQQSSPSRGMNPNSAPFNPAGLQPSAMYAQNQAQTQALQMQLMQLEIMRLQNIQAQQYQAEALAQAQRQQQMQQQQQQQQQPRDRRASLQINPMSANVGGGFDIRSAALSAQARKASQADQLRSQLGLGATHEELQQPPMTAGLGGRFGSRLPSLRYAGGGDISDEMNPPATPGQSTTVISGGTSLGNPTLANNPSSVSSLPSKSDSATSWRRGGNNNSVLSGNRAVTSPSVRVTPPPGERVSPPLPPAAPKARPQPLRFSPAASQPLTGSVVAVESDSTTSSADLSDDASSNGGSSAKSSGSSPTTPHSFASSADTPLSPREEAAKKLYEGLGIGRPAPGTAPGSNSATPPPTGHRMISSHPMRQPRGPPSGTEELGPKNFASRIRRKAIGGLGALMAGRERREMLIEAF